jgi:3-methyl-2-oxobutanoate hydroxymethyltransferase
VGSAERIILDAKSVAAAGAFAVVIEGVPEDVAAEITASIDVPTIGIGAGVGCDGQILVGADMLGLNPEFQPRFVKRFAELGRESVRAAQQFQAAVRAKQFPDKGHATPATTKASSQTAGPGASRSPKKKEIV